METGGSGDQASQRVRYPVAAAQSTRDRSMRDPGIDSVIALVAKTLEISEDELGPDSSMENTPLWASMEHLDVCLAFEQRFGKTLDMDEVSTATSIRALAALIPHDRL
jgi:acyl carrier protein